MRKLAVAALAASLLCFTPGVASAAITGVLKLGWEHTEVNGDNCSGECSSSDETEQGPNISAAVIAPFLGGDDSPWIIMGEGRLQSEQEDFGGGYKPHYNVGHMALHIAFHTDDYAVGGFYSIQNDHGSDVQAVGLEAYRMWGNFAVEGSAAWGQHQDSCSGCNDDYNVWNVHGRANYYFNDSWSAGLHAGYASFDYNFGTTNLTTVGAHVEYRIPDTAWSVRGEYTHGDANDTFEDYKTDTVRVALVLDLGSGNARERDARGFALNGADDLDEDVRLWE